LNIQAGAKEGARTSMFWQIILLNGVATFTEYNRLADFATQSIVSTTSFKPKEVFRLVDTYVNRIALSVGHTVVLVCLDFAVLAKLRSG
jgi:hypothetical protein